MHRRLAVRFLLVTLLLGALTSLSQEACADWKLVEEHYYSLTLGGHPCGYSHERVEQDEVSAATDGTVKQGARIRTSSRIAMRFVRLGQETTVELASEFVESSKGEPLEAVVLQKGAERVRYEFESPTKATLERGAVREVRELADGTWLTPCEVRAFVAARGDAKAPEIKFRALDVHAGFVVAEITMKRLDEVERVVEGRSVRCARYEVRSSIQPTVAVELYDAAGLVLESTTPIGLGDLVSTLTNKAKADESYARASFDLLAGTFVSTKPIARFLSRRELVVGLESVTAMPDLPSEGAQEFVRTGEKSARVTVRVQGASAAQASDEHDPRWRKANELIDSDSEAVRALLATARLKDDASDREKVDALRLLVARHVRSKNLATAFGSASEAAKTRSGDCTEHAVLLAALCRAAGIPSRVASGLVYVPELGTNGAGWGWHLWTQALVVPAQAKAENARGWVDFDATLGAGIGIDGYHIGHLLVATSDLSGGATDPAFSRALSLIGALKIEELAPVGATR